VKDSLDRASNRLPGVTGKSSFAVITSSLFSNYVCFVLISMNFNSYKSPMSVELASAKALASKACLVTGAAWTDLVWMETTLKALQLQH